MKAYTPEENENDDDGANFPEGHVKTAENLLAEGLACAAKVKAKRGDGVGENGIDGTAEVDDHNVQSDDEKAQGRNAVQLGVRVGCVLE